MGLVRTVLEKKMVSVYGRKSGNNITTVWIQVIIIVSYQHVDFFVDEWRISCNWGKVEQIVSTEICKENDREHYRWLLWELKSTGVVHRKWLR